MSDLLVLLVLCHVVGDFLLQNDWMQAKSRDTYTCAVHVSIYMLPFCLVLGWSAFPWWGYLAIAGMHYVQDRYGLHLKWMKLIKQTPPEKWPAGPLFVDQAWHLVQLALVATVAR